MDCLAGPKARGDGHPGQTKRPGSTHTTEMAMLVRKEFRRRGIGTGLLKTLLRDARKMGIKVLKRSVMAGNTPAIKLYPKLGFKSCDRVCGASKYKNRYVDEIIMVRRM